VPVPLLFRLYENVCGVVPKVSQFGGMCGFWFWTNCTASADEVNPLPSARAEKENPAQLVWRVSVEGVTPLPVVLNTTMYR
jgi:hypothetical protein